MIHYNDGTVSTDLPTNAKQASLIIKMNGSILLSHYPYPLPESLLEIEAELYLRGYKHPLPKNLLKLGGVINTCEYPHALPSKLEEIHGAVDLFGYNMPLPDSLVSVGSIVDLRNYPHKLPSNLSRINGCLILGGYEFELPSSLKEVGGVLDLDGYSCVFPSNLTSIGGTVYAKWYNNTLPPWILSVEDQITGQQLAAVYQNGEWRVRARGWDLTVAEALVKWSDEQDCLALVKNLKAQIVQSSKQKSKLLRCINMLGNEDKIEWIEDLFAKFVTRKDRYSNLRVLNLTSMSKPLSEKHTVIDSCVNLSNGYQHPLPATVSEITGSLFIGAYQHPLPERLHSVGEDIILGEYPHRLPASLTHIGGRVLLYGYKESYLPPWIITPSLPAGEITDANRLCAIYQNGNWRIRSNYYDISIDEACVYGQNRPVLRSHFEALINKINRSPLT